MNSLYEAQRRQYVRDNVLREERDRSQFLAGKFSVATGADAVATTTTRGSISPPPSPQITPLSVSCNSR